MLSLAIRVLKPRHSPLKTYVWPTENWSSARGRATEGATGCPGPATVGEREGDGSGTAGFFARCGEDANAAVKKPKASNTRMARTSTRSESRINVLPAFSREERRASESNPTRHCTRDVVDKASKKTVKYHRPL